MDLLNLKTKNRLCVQNYALAVHKADVKNKKKGEKKIQRSKTDKQRYASRWLEIGYKFSKMWTYLERYLKY